MQPNCPGCGRFAKYLSTTHWYNGWYNCIRLNLLCSKCGPVEVECV